MKETTRAVRQRHVIRDRSLVRKLMVVVIAVAVAAVSVGLIGVLQLRRLAANNEHLYEDEYLHTTQLTGLRRDMTIFELNLANYGASSSEEAMAALEKGNDALSADEANREKESLTFDLTPPRSEPTSSSPSLSGTRSRSRSSRRSGLVGTTRGKSGRRCGMT